MNIRTVVAALVATATAGALAWPSMAAASSTRGDNGPIVFTLELPHSEKLQVLDPATGSLRVLTHRHDVGEVRADWSPSGRTVVFEADSRNRAMIALVRADGTHRRILHPGLTGFLGEPAFVPHSNLIVFERNDEGAGDDSLWLMRRDGSHARRLTTNPFPGQGGDTDPNVSPDGRTVSFVRISVFDDQQALFSVRLDGSHLRRLIPYAADVAVKHDWSPDGKHIVVSVNANEGSRPHASVNVVILRPDGSHLRRLTHFRGRELNANVGSFSPDGQWIVYRVETGDAEPTLPGGRYALMKVSPRGGEPVLVAAIDGRPRSIDWGQPPSSAKRH
jgi:Tol biopolymer transport system component